MAALHCAQLRLITELRIKGLFGTLDAESPRKYKGSRELGKLFAYHADCINACTN